ncbi:MAG TPA: hypothetical protein VKZ44_08150, partial [Taishania sp.]|nr:hypothetical protein [Taishania sp.]
PFDFVQGRNGIGICGIPGRSKTEGFFIAVLQKTDSTPKSASLSKHANKSLQFQKDTKDISEFVHTEHSNFYLWNNQLLAIPTRFNNECLLLQDKMHLIKWGVNIGELSRKGLIPDHDLIMNHTLRRTFQTVELEESQAVKYLHGDTFQLPSNTPNGFVAPTFQNEPLGWVKNIGNRFNNHYPKEYRIRMRVD